MSTVKMQMYFTERVSPSDNGDGTWTTTIWPRDAAAHFTVNDIEIGDKLIYETTGLEVTPSLASFTIVDILGIQNNRFLECKIRYDDENDNIVPINDFSLIATKGTITRPTNFLDLMPTTAPDRQGFADYWAENLSGTNLERLDKKLGDILGLDSNGDYVPQGSSSSTSISDDIQELFQTLSDNSGNSNVSVSETAPENPSEGDLWWDSETGILKVYYTSGYTDTAGDDAWVDASPSGFNTSPGTGVTDSSLETLLESEVARLENQISNIDLQTVIDNGSTATTTAVIPFLYANQSSFPDASTCHGAIAHSHADSAMYFSHNGVWNKLANAGDLPDLSGYVSSTDLDAVQAEVTAIKNAGETYDTFQELVDYVNGLDSTQELDIINGLATVQADVDANELSASNDRTAIRTELSRRDSHLIHVDQYKSGTYTPDGSINKPYKTIQAAYDSAIAVSTILIAPGLYEEDLVVGANGLSSMISFIGLGGKGSNNVVILGNVEIHDPQTKIQMKDIRIESPDGTRPALHVNGCRQSSFQNMTIKYGVDSEGNTVVPTENVLKVTSTPNDGDIQDGTVDFLSCSIFPQGNGILVDGPNGRQVRFYRCNYGANITMPSTNEDTVYLYQCAAFGVMNQDSGILVVDQSQITGVNSSSNIDPDPNFPTKNFLQVTNSSLRDASNGGLRGDINKTGTSLYLIGNNDSNPDNISHLGTSFGDFMAAAFGNPSLTHLSYSRHAAEDYYTKTGWAGVENVKEALDSLKTDLSNVSGSGGSSVTVSDTAPSSPSSGDLWWNSNDGVLRIFYVEPNENPDSYWVATSSTVTNGTQDMSSITDGTSTVSFDSANEVVIDTDLNVNAINLSGHIIPTQNAQFDLGNAEYKIRHLFLSDNSLWIGDDVKVGIDENGIPEFKKVKRASGHVPKVILLKAIEAGLGSSVEEVAAHALNWFNAEVGIGGTPNLEPDAADLSDERITLKLWYSYAITNIPGFDVEFPDIPSIFPPKDGGGDLYDDGDYEEITKIGKSNTHVPLTEVNTRTDSFTLTASDHGTYIRIDSVADVVVSLPDDATDIPIGTTVVIGRNGDGNVVFAPEGGSIIQTPYSLQIALKFGKVTVMKTAANTWEIEGNLLQN